MEDLKVLAPARGECSTLMAPLGLLRGPLVIALAILLRGLIVAGEALMRMEGLLVNEQRNIGEVLWAEIDDLRGPLVPWEPQLKVPHPR